VARNTHVPDFIVIGAQRSGTTTLFGYLKKHPQIIPSQKKEVQFFSNNFHRGLGWYHAQFRPGHNKGFIRHIISRYRAHTLPSSGQGFLSGEASPYYLFHPHAPRRIRETVPHVRLIALLRNPIDRAYSHYNHMLRRGIETLPFEEAISKEEERLRGEKERMLEDENYYSFNHQHYSYLSRGIYVDQLRAWFQHFPRDQMFIAASEEFYRDPHSILEQITGFLKLPTLTLEMYKNYNNASYQGMDVNLRKRLYGYFEPHNQQLYDLLNLDLGWE
jgi:hypothetical protein